MLRNPSILLVPFRALGLAVAALALACSGADAALTLGYGFHHDALPFTFDNPTKLVFLPGGRMLVAEKGGIVYVVSASGSERHALWVREEEVLNTDDRGLLSIAVDPNYVNNHYLYFLYACDPDSNGIELDNYDDAFARLTRYTLSATDSNTVDYATRTILIGTNWREGWPNGSGTHNIADLEWGADGTLLVGAGDGAHFEIVDSGGNDPGLFGPTRSDPIEDIGAFRSQYLGSLDGKILRIDPATGLGLASNPFYDGNPASHRSRVWASGLRNPFRITRRPGTGSTNPAAGNPGTLYVGDVGWSTWEEVDVVNAPGQNFGWPCYHGPDTCAAYQAETPTHSGCSSIGTPGNPSPVRAPLAWFNRSFASASHPPGVVGYIMIGGNFTDGRNWPALFRGLYVCSDHAAGWIRFLRTNANDQLDSTINFATNAEGPTSFVNDPVTGDLWYASLWTGQIRRIYWNGVAAVETGSVADGVSLSPPRPNPARGAVALELEMSRPGSVDFRIVDVSGRDVWRSPPRSLAAGRSTLLWPGTTLGGRRPGAGLYFALVHTADGTRMQRLVVTR